MIENLVYLRYVIIFAACFLVVQYIGWIYWRLGMARRTVETDPEVMVQPRKKGEPVDPNSPQVVSYIFTEDPLFHLFVGVPFIFGLGLLAIQPFGGLVLVAYAALAFFFLSIIVEPDKLGVRIFLKSTYFNDCRVFAPWPIMKLILLPLGQNITETDDKEDKPEDTAKEEDKPEGDPKEKGKPEGDGKKEEKMSRIKVFSLVQQKPFATIAEGDLPLSLPDGKVQPPPQLRFGTLSDRQFFKLRFTWALDGLISPKRVVKNFFDYFYDDYKRNKKKFWSLDHGVRNDILGTGTTFADAVLQKQFMNDLVHSFEEANEALKDGIEEPMLTIGIKLMQVGIEDMKDVRKDGFLSQMERLNNALRKSETDRGASEAEARTRITDAQQNKLAFEAEMETRKANAEKEKEAIEKEVEVARQQAIRNMQPLLQQLEAVKNPEAQRAFLFAKLSELGSTQMTEILKQFAKSMGLNVENGGDITFTSVAGDPTRFHPGMGAAEMVKTFMEMFNLYTKGGPTTT